MNHVVMEEIPFDPDMDTLAEWLRIGHGSARMVSLGEMVDTAKAMARPKAVYRVVRVETRGDDFVVVDGTRLTSRVLQVNLAGVHRAFVYIATCGVELETWARSLEAPLDRFQAEAIATMALMAARQGLVEHLEQVFRPGRLGEMNPGSLQDWPLSEQRPIFDLLGDPEASIGVQLLDSCLMSPTKTTSGLLFSTEDGFYNCQLCPMEDCPGRRAPYDAGLYDRKYRHGTEPAPGDWAS
jgi:hypothetical protein